MTDYLVLKKKARTLALRRDTKTIYVPVDRNIYFDGLSYRVRVTRNGIRTSKNFRNKRKAFKLRNELVAN